MPSRNAIAGADGLGFQTEFRLLRNRFSGCVSTGCRFYDVCSNRMAHKACPFGDEAFEAHNPRDRELVGHNDILNTLRNYVADVISGTPTSFDPEVTHVSVGTGTADTDPDSTQLQNEVYRDTFVEISRPSTGKATYYWYFRPSDFTGTAEEWAFIANNATGSLGSGDAINRFRQHLEVASEDAVVGQYSIMTAGA